MSRKNEDAQFVEPEDQVELAAETEAEPEPVDADEPEAEAEPEAPVAKTQKQLLAEQQATTQRIQDDKAERLVEQLTSTRRKRRS